MSTELSAAITDSPIVLTSSSQCEPDHSFWNIYVWVWWIWCQGRRWLELWQQFQTQIDFPRNQILFVIDIFFKLQSQQQLLNFGTIYHKNRKFNFKMFEYYLFGFFSISNIVFHYSRVDTRGKLGFGKLLII